MKKLRLALLLLGLCAAGCYTVRPLGTPAPGATPRPSPTPEAVEPPPYVCRESFDKNPRCARV